MEIFETIAIMARRPELQYKSHKSDRIVAEHHSDPKSQKILTLVRRLGVTKKLLQNHNHYV